MKESEKSGMILGIVIPCYNEEKSLDEVTKSLGDVFEKLIDKDFISKESFVCYVDDGSQDGTWAKICALKTVYPFVRGLKLSRNFGQQNALIAGMMHFRDQADAIITMDADMQDDINKIEAFVAKYQQGYDVIYGVREKRTHDRAWKKWSANTFYRLQQLMGIESVPNHAHYRLLSSKALQTLADFKEIDMYLRGVIPLIGYKSCTIPYQRQKRFSGESKYSIGSLFSLAFDGITSFSIIPLRLITMMGLLLFLFSLGMIVWIFMEKIIYERAVAGWASVMTSIYFIGGIQMMSLGIIGEYIGRIFKQSKARPRYIVEEEV